MSHYHDDAIREQQDERVALVYARASAVQETRYVRLREMESESIIFFNAVAHLYKMQIAFMDMHGVGFTFYREWYRWLLRLNNQIVSCP